MEELYVLGVINDFIKQLMQAHCLCIIKHNLNIIM